MRAKIEGKHLVLEAELGTGPFCCRRQQPLDDAHDPDRPADARARAQ
jgi:hypothetical protein